MIGWLPYGVQEQVTGSGDDVIDGMLSKLPNGDPGFHAEGSLVELGALRVEKKTLVPLRLTRVADSDADGFYQLLLPLRGTMHTAWDGRRLTTGVGDLIVHDMARVTRADFEAPTGTATFQTAAVTIPKSLISLPDDHVDQVLGRRIPAGEGLGALLAGFVTNVADHASAYTPAECPRLGMALLDLVSALFTRTVERDGEPAPESHRQALTLRIQASVLRRLGEPDLSPGVLAAAHHISVSYLHRLFQEQGTTVAGWVRAQRLERARRDLADPALRHVPIHGIASRWGFSHAADFSRAFRRTYGASPRDYRHEPPGV